MPLSYRQLGQPIVESLTLPQVKQQVFRGADFVDDDALLTGLIIAARQYVEKKMNRAIFNRPALLARDFFPFPDFDSTKGPRRVLPFYSGFWEQLAIRLPYGEAQSVESVSFLDNSNTRVTLPPDAYIVDTLSEPCRIFPASLLFWPWFQNFNPNNILINFTAGSFNNLVTDTLVVSDGSVTISKAAELSAGPLLLTSAITLVDSNSNPVPFVNNSGVLTVTGPASGATLTSTYYVGQCPQPIIQAMLLTISFFYNNRDAAVQNPPKAIEMGVDALLAPYIFESFGWEY